jgi:hypothetical protein
MLQRRRQRTLAAQSQEAERLPANRLPPLHKAKMPCSAQDARFSIG